MSKSKLHLLQQYSLLEAPKLANHKGMEKCKVVDEDGKGLIKEHKGDCAWKGNSCAENNKAGNPDTWITVPKGQCDKINEGDLSGISDDIKAKIETDGMNE